MPDHHVLLFLCIAPWLQGSSCVLAINSNAFAGEVPPRLELPAPPPAQLWGPVGGDPVAAARVSSKVTKGHPWQPT